MQSAENNTSISVVCRLLLQKMATKQSFKIPSCYGNNERKTLLGTIGDKARKAHFHV